MGMDGLSMANTGAVKESTSADYANRTEQIIQSDKNSNLQVQTLSNDKRVQDKERDEEQGQKRGRSNNKKSSENEEGFEDGLVIEENSENEEFDIEDLENPNREFYVKLNSKDDIIELYDSSSDRLIETISGNELQQLIKRLNMASGIFINKKV